MNELLSRFAHYGPYVWGAYGTVLFCLAAEVIVLFWGKGRTRQALRDAELVEELRGRDRAAEVNP